MTVIYSPQLPPVRQDPEALATLWGYKPGVPRPAERVSPRNDPKAIARLWGYR